jgi:hypothetical protein
LPGRPRGGTEASFRSRPESAISGRKGDTDRTDLLAQVGFALSADRVRPARPQIIRPAALCGNGSCAPPSHSGQHLPRADHGPGSRDERVSVFAGLGVGEFGSSDGWAFDVWRVLGEAGRDAFECNALAARARRTCSPQRAVPRCGEQDAGPERGYVIGPSDRGRPVPLIQVDSNAARDLRGSRTSGGRQRWPRHLRLVGGARCRWDRRRYSRPLSTR